MLISLAATICFGVIGPSLRAQATKPGPENKKLEVFLGSWMLEWDTKASVFGPAGRITGVERYESMPGGFFVQMNREAKGPQGDFRDHFVFGYDPVAKKMIPCQRCIDQDARDAAYAAKFPDKLTW